MSQSGYGRQANAEERQRQRVTRACEPCRRKKIRCNGEQPCSACAEAHADHLCAYVEAKDRSAYSRRYVAGLESRLKSIEHTLAAAAAQSSSTLPPDQVRPYFDTRSLGAEEDPSASVSPPASPGAPGSGTRHDTQTPSINAPTSSHMAGSEGMDRHASEARSLAPSDTLASSGRLPFPAQGARMRYDRTGRTIRYIGPSASSSLLYDVYAALSEDELEGDSDTGAEAGDGTPDPASVDPSTSPIHRETSVQSLRQEAASRLKSSLDGRDDTSAPQGSIKPKSTASGGRGSRGSLTMQAHRWGLRDRESSPIRPSVSPLGVLLDDSTLPARSITDQLVRVFFHYVHSLFPILDHERFMLWYDQLCKAMDAKTEGAARSSEEAKSNAATEVEVDPMFPSLLFAVLACASRIAPSEAVCPPGQPVEGESGTAGPPLSLAGMHFYARAHMLLVERRLGVQQTRLAMGPLTGGDAGLDMLIGPGLDVSAVQTLGLLSYFMTSSNCSPRAWDLAGQAVRNATDLGLHRSLGPEEFAAAPPDAELRRRVWWCVYMLDQMLCVSLGRPLGIEDVSIDASLPSEPFHIEHPQELLMGFRAFVRLIRLQGVIATNAFLRTRASRALSTAHAAHANAPRNSPARRKAKEAIAIARTRSQKLQQRAQGLAPLLQKWFERAPSQLKAGVHQPGSVLGLYSCVAFVLYRSTLLLLHRSFIPGGLVSAWREEVDATASQALEQVGTSCNVLISAARSITASLPPSPFLLEYTQQLLVAGGYTTLRAWHFRSNPSMAAHMLSLAHGAAAALKRLDASHAAPAARPLRHVLAHVIQQLAFKLGRLSQPTVSKDKTGKEKDSAAPTSGAGSSNGKRKSVSARGKKGPNKRLRKAGSVAQPAEPSTTTDTKSASAPDEPTGPPSQATLAAPEYPPMSPSVWPGPIWNTLQADTAAPIAPFTDSASAELDRALDETFASLLMGATQGETNGQRRTLWPRTDEPLPRTPHMSLNHGLNPPPVSFSPPAQPSSIEPRIEADDAGSALSPVSLNIPHSDPPLSPSTLAMLDYDGFQWLFGDAHLTDSQSPDQSGWMGAPLHSSAGGPSVSPLTHMTSPYDPVHADTPAHHATPAQSGSGLWGLWE